MLTEDTDFSTYTAQDLKNIKAEIENELDNRSEHSKYTLPNQFILLGKLQFEKINKNSSYPFIIYNISNISKFGPPAKFTNSGTLEINEETDEYLLSMTIKETIPTYNIPVTYIIHKYISINCDSEGIIKSVENLIIEIYEAIDNYKK